MNTKHEEILSDYFDGGLSLEILEAKHGRSTVQISRLVREAVSQGRVRTLKPKDRRAAVGAEALSIQHKRLGRRFVHWRSNVRMMPSQAADRLGISGNRYASLEAGIHHITLLELVFICEKLGWDLADVLTTMTRETITQ